MEDEKASVIKERKRAYLEKQRTGELKNSRKPEKLEKGRKLIIDEYEVMRKRDAVFLSCFVPSCCYDRFCRGSSIFYC